MHRFINSPNSWFAEVKSNLKEGELIKYSNCLLPPCCGGAYVNFGIERCNGVYTLYIDQGYDCATIARGWRIKLFRKLLKQGQISFFDFNDVRVFLKSLHILYEFEFY